MKKYIIKTPAGIVAGFSLAQQRVQIAGHPDFAKLFRSESAARAFIERYADAGYGLESGAATVVCA